MAEKNKVRSLRDRAILVQNVFDKEDEVEGFLYILKRFVLEAWEAYMYLSVLIMLTLQQGSNGALVYRTKFEKADTQIISLHWMMKNNRLFSI